MNAAKMIKKAIRDPRYRFTVMNNLGLYRRLSDEAFLKKAFCAKMGYALDLEHPQTYSEKLQWLKLYDRNPEYPRMVDKVEAKKFAAALIGEQYIIPTIGVWDSVDDIPFETLPEQFVLKCTHNSGGIVICKDKRTLNIEEAKARLNKELHRDFYLINREWPYKLVKPRILAETYMEDSRTKELRDYKFFTFDGEVKALFIATERGSKTEETKFDFFDENYNHLPFINGHPNADVMPEKPQCFEQMKELARKLGKGIPHVRVDFYEMDGRVFFGEMTFFHWSGMMPFEPAEWDRTFGDWIKLPEVKRCGE